jgi:hypothetical protein
MLASNFQYLVDTLQLMHYWSTNQKTLETLSTWTSTGIQLIPKASYATTAAIFGPTP